MASTVKQRLRRFNGTDYDTIHLETQESQVIADYSKYEPIGSGYGTSIRSDYRYGEVATFNDLKAAIVDATNRMPEWSDRIMRIGCNNIPEVKNIGLSRGYLLVYLAKGPEQYARAKFVLFNDKYPYSDTCMYLTKYNGVWGDPVYDNPLLYEGVEYRTINWFVNKPVYTMHCNLGTVNALTHDYEFQPPFTATDIVGYSAYVRQSNGLCYVVPGHTNPSRHSGVDWTSTLFVANDYIYFNFASGFIATSYELHLIVRYTKT